MNIFYAILFICLGILLAVILFPFGVIAAILTMIIKRCNGEAWYTYFYRIALGIDMLGNTVCGDLFNITLIHYSTGYHFGLDGETISSAIGKNVEKGTLTWTGKALNALLNKIQKNHSILSIDTNVNNTD